MNNWIKLLSESYISEVAGPPSPNFSDDPNGGNWPTPQIDPNSGLQMPGGFPSPGWVWDRERHMGRSRQPFGVRGLSPITDPSWTYSEGPPPSWTKTANGITYTLVYQNGQYFLQATARHGSTQWRWYNGSWELYM